MTDSSIENWKEFDSLEVALVFDEYPGHVREKLMRLRQLIFETASATEGVGELEEALRWGEPSYLTSESRSGSIVHIDSKQPTEYGIYVHCQTDIVARFKDLYPDQFEFDGNRGVLFDLDNRLPDAELRDFISMALTYHLDKKKRKQSQGGEARQR